jgi:hypothetical protein
VRERLDRAVCNALWNLLFPLASVSNEPHFRSDHRLVFADTEFFDTKQIQKRSGGQKFEAIRIKKIKSKLFSLFSQFQSTTAEFSISNMNWRSEHTYG